MYGGHAVQIAKRTTTFQQRPVDMSLPTRRNLARDPWRAVTFGDERRSVAASLLSLVSFKTDRDALRSDIVQAALRAGWDGGRYVQHDV